MDEDNPAIAQEVTRYVDELFPAYKDKHLLVAGGLADQPSRYLELIRLVRATDNKTQLRFTQLTAKADD